MDYGFAFLSAVDLHKDVALAESKGFTHAWLYDTQMICADVEKKRFSVKYEARWTEWWRERLCWESSG
jgi:hypothetical protein